VTEHFRASSLMRLRQFTWGWIARGLLLVLGPLLWTRPKLRDGWGERLGRYTQAAALGTPRLWLHGASAGDVKALLPLARAAKSRWPRSAVVLTTRTSTGQLMARGQSCFDEVLYAPWDLPRA